MWNQRIKKNKNSLTIFIIKTIDKKILFQMLFLIIIAMIETIILILLPHFLMRIHKICSLNSLIFVGMLIVNIVLAYFESMGKTDLETKFNKYRNTFMLELFEIKYYTPFQIMESNTFSQNYYSANKALESNVVGLEAYMNSTFELCLNICISLISLIYLNITSNLIDLSYIMISIIVACILSIGVIKKNQVKYEMCLEDERLANKIFMHSILPNTIKEVKITNASKWNIKRYKESANRRNKNYRRYIISNFIVEIILLGLLGIVGIIVINSMYRQSVSSTTLTSMIIALLSVLFSIEPIFKSWTDTLIHRNETIKLKNFIEKYQRKKMQRGSEKKDIQKTVIEHLSFRYSGETKEIIKDLSFEVKKGMKIAVIGKNGSGKSTLMKILCGLYQPDSGSYYALTAEDKKSFITIDDVSLVPQNFKIYPFTLIENIAMKDNLNSEEIKKIKQIIADLNLSCIPQNKILTKDIDQNGIEISGGEKQKISIARALFQNRPIVILDEPTSALDPISEKNIYGVCEKMFIDKISYYVSHRLGSTSFCDMVLFYDENDISVGTHDDLYNTNKSYRDFYDSQKNYYED